MQIKRTSKPGCELVRRNLPVTIDVQGIEHRVGASPFLSCDSTVSVEVIDGEHVPCGAMGGFLTVELGDTVGQQPLERDDSLREAGDALAKLLVGHPVLLVHPTKASRVDGELFDVLRRRMLRVELAGQLAHGLL